MSNIIQPWGLLKGTFGGGVVAEDTLVLSHFEGVDGATTYTAEVGGEWDLGVGVELDTAQFKFGAASLRITPEFELSPIIPTSIPTATVQGDLTVEAFVRAADLETPDIFVLGQGDIFINLFIDQMGSGTASMSSTWMQFDDVVFLTLTAVSLTILPNVWYHIALVKDGTTYSMYLDGVRVDTETNAAVTDYVPSHFGFGASGDFDVWFDELRISQVARYSGASFTVPTAAFTID